MDIDNAIRCHHFYVLKTPPLAFTFGSEDIASSTFTQPSFNSKTQNIIKEAFENDKDERKESHNNEMDALLYIR